MTAVGDVQMEIVLCLTLRGTVRELAALMDALTSSGLVVRCGHVGRDGDKCEGIDEFCSETGAHNR